MPRDVLKTNAFYDVSPTARLGIDTSTNLGVMAVPPSEDGASTWLTIL
jgi:hypothetical protein